MITAISMNNKNNQKTSFGTIHFTPHAKRALSTLKTEQLEEIRELIKSQETNKYVDINLFGNESAKSLSANIFDADIPDYLFHTQTSHSQRFYESMKGFINRCCKIANKRAQEVSADIKKREIIKSMESKNDIDFSQI